METKEAVQMLRQLIFDNGLPKIDMALFGVKCLYCGKSDRIRRLEDPDALHGKIGNSDYTTYADLWEQLAKTSGPLGICKFCQNLLRLYVEEGKTEALYE